MTIIDASRYPHVSPLGDLKRFKRAAYRYDHRNAARCCLNVLYFAHEAGSLELPNWVQPCVECGRAWTLQAGTWRIGTAQPEPEQRPLAKLRHGREANLERLKVKREKRDDLQAKE